MAVPFARTSFSSGEISPSLFGHVDFAKFPLGASTMRNMWVSYRGGANSRAGTRFIGFSGQVGRVTPPRLIPFQFSANQGIVLEFGNQYMRVIVNGGFASDLSFPITAASQANPCQITASGTIAGSASANNGAVATSYAPGDYVTLAGGTYTSPAVLYVNTTTLVATSPLNPGVSGYVPGDTLHVFDPGSVQPTPAVLTVTSTQVVSAIIDAAGSGGTNGTQTVTGTTGTGTTFQALVTVSGGAITAVLSISIPGAYTVNPTSLSAEPVTGAGLTGSKLGLSMGINAVTVTTGGVFSVNPPSATFSQAAGGTTSGTGATFQNAVFGPYLMTVSNPGGYSVTPSNPVAQATTTGGGSGATFNVTWPSSANFNNGDWVQISGVVGMVAANGESLNGRTFIVQNVTSTTFTLTDVFGNNIDTTAYTSYTNGGVISRLYTLSTPYGEADLRYIKYTQSADSMTLCCWNQLTGTSYGTYDLTRIADNNWTLISPTFGASIVAPGGAYVTPSDIGTTEFQYCVTAVSSVDGSESVASNIATINNSVDITSTAGSITVTWGPVTDAAYYNVYRANPGYDQAIPAGSQFGFSGIANGTAFIDSNIQPDFTQVPPTHQDPFANNNPGVAAYFQGRRFYAATPNDPDTYWASKPGDYYNFDTRTPSIADDSISGTPWSVQVNGVQFMIPMPGGLVVLTGQSAWQVNGTGSSGTSAQALTPSTQQAQPQAYFGCSQIVVPIRIDYDILYVDRSESIAYDLSYNYWVNIYTGADLTQLSSHLFYGFTIKEWAYAHVPNKIVWAVRNDGVLLSLTFLKQQEVAGWARHDTQGYFTSVCSVIEPPVDAVYLAVQRVTPASQYAHMIERMDDRSWQLAEDCWCVDAGLALTPASQNTTLHVSSPTGLGAITGVTGLVGGQNYSAATTASVVDANGTGIGSGAVPTLTISGGAITGVTFSGGSQGINYTFPALVFSDPAGTGSGASAAPVLSNSAVFIAGSAVFNSDMVGWYIRAAGGLAVITAYTSTTQVTVNILSPFVEMIPYFPWAAVPMINAGQWSLGPAVTEITNLDHLNGMTVTGLVDGNIITPQVVSNGGITLSTAASMVVVGLPFRAQLQTTYMDLGQPTIQGQRKKMAAVTIRTEASRTMKVGANQPDASTLAPARIDGNWSNLVPAPDLGQPAYNALATPLYTGDTRVILPGGYQKQGQICLQQDNPLPMQVLAVMAEIDAGDLPQPPGPVAQQRQR